MELDTLPPARAGDPGLAADILLVAAPDWRYLAYDLDGDVVSTVIKGGTVAHRR